MNWSDWFVYDETSPSCLRNKVARGRVAVGAVAGWQREDGYWCLELAGSSHLVHRVVYEMCKGPLAEDQEVDHEDGLPSNCKIGNLRAVPHVVNGRNLKQSKANTSGTTGVVFDRKVNKHGREYTYWVAVWIDNQGVRARKAFSIQKLGDDSARAKAEQHRREVIQALGDYSERHGT